MASHSEAARRPPRAPMPRRNRRRWAGAAVVVGCWALLLMMTGSVVAGTALLMLLAALGIGCIAGLRSMGVGADHPWVRQLASRPWRDGQDVLRLGLRHLGEVFVMTPSGSLLAPNAVQLRMSPRDFGSLSDIMDMDLASQSAAQVYAERVAASGARFAGLGPAELSIVSDPSVPEGRYAVRQGRPVLAPVPGGGFPHAHDGDTRTEATRAAAAGAAVATMTELRRPAIPPVPLLRLVTGDSVTQTQASPARAGRGEVDLVLPEVPTVSREHARFSYSAGQWWITNLGRNGLTLNGTPLVEAQAVRDGDSIRWGRTADALLSRVEIG